MVRDRRIFRRCVTGREILAALDQAMLTTNIFSRKEAARQTSGAVPTKPIERRGERRRLGVGDLRGDSKRED